MTPLSFGLSALPVLANGGMSISFQQSQLLPASSLGCGELEEVDSVRWNAAQFYLNIAAPSMKHLSHDAQCISTHDLLDSILGIAVPAHHIGECLQRADMF